MSAVLSTTVAAGMASRAAGKTKATPAVFHFDAMLFWCWIGLLLIGVVMVASASIGYAAATENDPFFYFKKHLAFLFIGSVVSLVLVRIPLAFWYHLAPTILLLAFLLMVVVLIPGVGIETNGARRWIGAGGATIQVAELAKAALIIFLSAYLVRQGDTLRASWAGVSKPFGILMIFLVLLLLQPDFGSIVVMAGITVALVFLAGMHFLKFMSVAILGIGGLSFFVLSSEYRMRRITGFLDPWADQFDSGYQLTQSLIAFGRGEWIGVGLGNSLQKLLYLPEAHTDFVFAVLAEELGLLGSLSTILLLCLMIGRIFQLGVRAVDAGVPFGGFVAIGTATMFAVQSLINIGVACGLFPTKGLTLPFISSGGSSLLVCMALTAICLRMSQEIQTTAQRPLAKVDRRKAPSNKRAQK
jgi:cell division protein FtsW